MSIHRYEKADADVCLGLFRSNADRYFDPSELVLYEEFLAGDALKGTYYVARQGGPVVGAGGYSFHKGAYWLDWGIVHRLRHGRGIGTQLVQYRLAKIREEAPSATIRLTTSQYTVGFYERQGFDVQEFFKDGFGKGLHKYLLEVRGKTT